MLFHELRIEKRRYINKIKGKLYLNAQKEIFASSHVAAGSQFLFGPFSATEPHQSLIDPFVNWHLQIAFPARSHHESGARARTTDAAESHAHPWGPKVYFNPLA
jgi:hypothetical protein